MTESRNSLTAVSLPLHLPPDLGKEERSYHHPLPSLHPLGFAEASVPPKMNVCIHTQTLSVEQLPLAALLCASSQRAHPHLCNRRHARLRHLWPPRTYLLPCNCQHACLHVHTPPQARLCPCNRKHMCPHGHQLPPTHPQVTNSRHTVSQPCRPPHAHLQGRNCRQMHSRP